ncbi:MAG: UDP-N-acetylglucosamine 2-epimerase, partial [Methanobacterium sp.]
MPINILYISGSRADYGRAYYTLKNINNDIRFNLVVLATCMHLSIESGYTVNEIKEEFEVKEVDMLLSNDSKGAMAKSMGIGLIGITQSIEDINPDLILLLGDRGEMLAGAIAGNHLGIPVAHIGGGHISGSVDDRIRDAITIFSDYHFVANKNGFERVVSIGAEPSNVYIVGAPDLEPIKNNDYTEKSKIISEFDIDTQKDLIILSFHPVVEKNGNLDNEIEIICDTLLKFENFQVIATFPNMDAGGRKIKKILEKYRKNPNIHIYDHIPYKKYLGLLNIARLIIGNSSTGIIEAPSFKLPAINIGERQKGRERASNVIDVKCNENEINMAIKKIFKDKAFNSKLKTLKNPY